MSAGQKTESFFEFFEKCESDADVIYVREEIEGSWRNVALADLPPDRRREHIARWYREKRLPHKRI